MKTILEAGRLLRGLILAAGDGRRLQSYVQEFKNLPLPKQYVNFFGRRSMLENTFQRAEKLIRAEAIFTVVSRAHLKHAEVRRQLVRRASETIVIQPANKETGPGILLPLMHIYKQNPQAIVAVFPSDHFVLEEDRFMRDVQRAAEMVAFDPSRMVLLAIEPRYAETEYGYIVPREDSIADCQFGTRTISEFIEKPDGGQARQLMKAGALWNTMTMVFELTTFLQIVEKVNPVLSRKFYRILDSLGTPEEQESIESVYRSLEPVNFSRQILEPIAERFPDSVLVLPVRRVFWSDLGSPARIAQVLNKLTNRQTDKLPAVVSSPF